MVGITIKASEIFEKIDIEEFPNRIDVLSYFKERIYLPKEKIVVEIDNKGKKLVKEMKNEKVVEILKEIKKELIRLLWLKEDILDLLWEKFFNDNDGMFV